MVTDRIAWMSDLIRLEIALWDRISELLRQRHDLSLAFFEALHVTARAPGGRLRIGEIGRDLRITQGAASKLVDRIEAAGLIAREADSDDRRASWVTLTDRGQQALAAASETYAAALAQLLDSALSPPEQQHMHALVTRLLRAADGAAQGGERP